MISDIPRKNSDSIQLTVFGREASRLASQLKYDHPINAQAQLSNNVDDNQLSTPPKVNTPVRKKGSFAGVFVPTCENMWGVLIFLRFYYIVGQEGVGLSILAVSLSFIVAFATATCLSAIASSGGYLSEGGPYYMISRALGPYIGATVGITYFMGLTMLGVLEAVGAVEALQLAAPTALKFTGVNQVLGTCIMAAIALAVKIGISFVTKIGIVFVVVVIATLLMFYVGLFASPHSGLDNPWVTGLSSDTLKLNWGSHFDEGVGFGTTLSIFFPCFTGILSGANRTDVLRDPPRNIKYGTYGAIWFSFFMYLSLMLLWGAVAEYPYLKGEVYPGTRRLSGAPGGPNSENIVGEIVWPSAMAAYIGIFVSSVSQALQCIIVAPRLLRAISADHLLNILRPLAQVDKKSGEPVRALGVTYIIAAGLVLIGSLDTIAPLLTMCFLVCYVFLNLSCFVLTLLQTPTWRPHGIFKLRWRVWYLITSSIGFLTGLAIMFIVSVYWALAVFFLAALIYLLFEWKGEEAEWGSGVDGLRVNLALNFLNGVNIDLRQKAIDNNSHTRSLNWRPQVLILNDDELDLIQICSFFRKSRGMCISCSLIEFSNETDNTNYHEPNQNSNNINTNISTNAIHQLAPNLPTISRRHSDDSTGHKSPLHRNKHLLDIPKPAHNRANSITSIFSKSSQHEHTIHSQNQFTVKSITSGVVLPSPNINTINQSNQDTGKSRFQISKHHGDRRKVTRDIKKEINARISDFGLRGFGDVLFCNRAVDGAVYSIQLSGIGPVRPNTVLLKWPNLQKDPLDFASQNPLDTPSAFVDILVSALAADKAVIAVKNIQAILSVNQSEESPINPFVDDYVDLWWFIHDGGLLLLCAWLLREHSSFRHCTTRLFIVLENVTRAEADSAGEKLRDRLRRRQILPNATVHVVVLNEKGGSLSTDSHICIKKTTVLAPFSHTPIISPGDSLKIKNEDNRAGFVEHTIDDLFCSENEVGFRDYVSRMAETVDYKRNHNDQERTKLDTHFEPNTPGYLSLNLPNNQTESNSIHLNNVHIDKLNQMIKDSSGSSRIVIMNLPDVWGIEFDDCHGYVEYAEGLTRGLDRVLFVHAAGNEVFNLF